MSKILIVDDSNMSRRNLRRILEGAGHQVVEAAEGMAALESYFIEKPEIVFLDMTMKGMHGLDVLAKLRGMDPAARVVIATADIQKSTQSMAQENGACGFVHKPFVDEDILKAAQAALRKEGAHDPH
jgi:two-component system, chemotaxis family, chemotaxis protein CheY